MGLLPRIQSTWSHAKCLEAHKELGTPAEVAVFLVWAWLAMLPCNARSGAAPALSIYTYRTHVSDSHVRLTTRRSTLRKGARHKSLVWVDSQTSNRAGTRQASSTMPFDVTFAICQQVDIYVWLVNPPVAKQMEFHTQSLTEYMPYRSTPASFSSLVAIHLYQGLRNARPGDTC